MFNGLEGTNRDRWLEFVKEVISRQFKEMEVFNVRNKAKNDRLSS